MADPNESGDELCIELAGVQVRAGKVAVWTAADVLEEYADDLRYLGYVPPQWGGG